MTTGLDALRPAIAAAWSRFERNRSAFAARLGRVRREQFAIDGRPLAVTAGLAGAMVLLVALALDPLVAGLPESLPDWLRGFFQAVTRFGKSDWLLVPSAIVALAVCLGDWGRVSRVVAAAWSEIASLALVLFAAVAVSGLATDLLKAIVGRSRPGFSGDAVFAFHPLTLGGYAHYSFPSGHSTTVAAFAVIVAATFTGRLRALLLLAAATVAVSRVMIGVHYPADVVAGMLVGGGVGLLILRLAAEARVGFSVRPDGTIAPRFGALAGLRRRQALPALCPGLWRALARERR